MNSFSQTGNTVDSVQLESAFLQFNELSEKLTESYRDLENQVATLSGELVEARSERLVQLTEKEILADTLESLLEALPGGVIVVDTADRITRVNAVALDLLGERLIGRRWRELADDVFIPGRQQLSLQDGRCVSLSVRDLGKGQGRIILLTDVTETHELQEELNRRQRLVSLGEMVARLAHQLRTPLGAAMLYMSSLEHPNIKRADIKRISERSRERLHHLERMVNDMLIFARGDHAELDAIDIGSIAARLEENLTEQYAAAGFSLSVREDVSDDLSIRVNVDTLLSAFQNLADNALEALTERQQTEDEGWCGKLRIEIVADEDQMIRFDFIDNGNGIDETIQERILEPFYTTRSSGTGLGLAVVNASLESFNGKLTISSVKGEGSRFRAILPVADRQELLPGGYSNSIDKHEPSEKR